MLTKTIQRYCFTTECDFVEVVTMLCNNTHTAQHLLEWFDNISLQRVQSLTHHTKISMRRCEYEFYESCDYCDSLPTSDASLCDVHPSYAVFEVGDACIREWLPLECLHTTAHLLSSLSTRMLSTNVVIASIVCASFSASFSAGNRECLLLM